MIKEVKEYEHLLESLEDLVAQMQSEKVTFEQAKQCVKSLHLYYKEIPFKKRIKTTNSIVVSRGDELVGTFKYIDKELYFLDWFSKEWEEYDYSFNLLTSIEIKEVEDKCKPNSVYIK
jgi:hypothetical protein|tara:strand:- start:56 stop:409 length:354 start_codon:yes stop_codon:yes gene_type:complete